MERRMPRYPIYIPSKGRADRCLTADMFVRDGVPFKLVVEESDRDAYAERYGSDALLILPFSNRGSVIPARNWIKQHSIDSGAKRHWQWDDNIRTMYRLYKTKRIPCRSGVALAVCEDFTDRYTNVAISGFQYKMFAPETHRLPPFVTNCHVYSCSLVLNEIPMLWRGRYNEDTDICLQALAAGWTTILLNAFLADKMPTMTMKGGNTSELYQYTDGRLKMARALEKNWPITVTTRRRYQRPQHVVSDNWKKFDTPLIRRDDLELPSEPDEYGLEAVEVKPIRSEYLRNLLGK